MTDKHRDDLVEALRRIADLIDTGLVDPTHLLGLRNVPRENWTNVSSLGAESGLVLFLRIEPIGPATREHMDDALYDTGVGGFCQIGPNSFSFSKAEVAERISTLMGEVSIRLGIRP